MTDTTSAQDHVGLIRRGYEAHARGDFAGVFAILHPEFEIIQTTQVPWGGVYRGRDQAKAFFGLLAQHIESQVSPEEYVEAGDQVAVVGRIRGHVRRNGHPFDLRVVHIWTLCDGLAARFEAYIDTPGMLYALAAEANTDS